VSEESSPFALEAKGLAKAFPYGEEVLEILTEVDLGVVAGKSVSIRGESGCGKTTLLNLLARLDSADVGELYWNGEFHDPKLPPGPRDAARRASLVGVVYQAYYLIPEMNVLENVLLAARLAGSIGKDAKQRARELLDRVGVSNRERQLPQKLSGGERQRVAIARALLNRPKVILADEPTGNLDERSAGDVMELLLEACREEDAGLVLVTHNPVFSKATDEALHLVKGVLSSP
jgi:ABC-type lipoprotein export system ATPase subunit